MSPEPIRLRRADGTSLAGLLPASRSDLERLLVRYDDVRDRDLRGRDRRFVVEGARVVRRFLRSAWPCESILATEVHLRSLEPSLARRRDRPVLFLADDSTMTAVAGYRMHGGCLAIGVRDWHTPSFDVLMHTLPTEGPLRVLVAEGVVHVDNLGGLFRSAACFGVDAVVLDQGCADPLLRKPIRFSMGRVFDLPWCVSRDLRADIARLPCPAYALELAPSAAPLSAWPRDDRWALVVGGEARGLSAETLAACRATFAIPSRGEDEEGEARSLNVSVAASIALYEAMRGS